MARCRSYGYLELNKEAAEVYKDNVAAGGDEIMIEDIKNLNVWHRIAILRPHILTRGVQCPQWSKLWAQKGFLDNRSELWCVICLVVVMRPRAALFENVANLLEMEVDTPRPSWRNWPSIASRRAS